MPRLGRRSITALVLATGCGSTSSDSGGTGDATSNDSASSMVTSATQGGSVDTSGGATGSSSDGETGTPACPPAGPWPDGGNGPYVVSHGPDGMPLGSGAATSLSADGRFVAYTSLMDPTGTPEYKFAIFVYDALCDTAVRVPFDPPPEPVTEAIDPVISDDGSTVVFATRNAEQIAHVYACDLADGTIEPIDVDDTGTQLGITAWHFETSSDGRLVVFHADAALDPDDANEELDIYLRDREAQTTERVSLGADGADTNGFSRMPAMSADGRYIAYESGAINIVPDAGPAAHIYVHDRETGTTEIVSLPPEGVMPAGGSGAPSISDDGRFVAFHSDASNLVDNDTNMTTDVFIRDRQSGTTERVSIRADGTELTGPSVLPEMSADGRVIVFGSGYITLGGSDAQIYARDRGAGVLWRLSESAAGEVADNIAVQGRVSADGAWGAFESQAYNLLEAPKTVGGWDAYAVKIPQG